MTTLASYPGPYLTLEKHTKRKLNSEKIWTTNDQDRDKKSTKHVLEEMTNLPWAKSHSINQRLSIASNSKKDESLTIENGVKNQNHHQPFEGAA